jgi:hypothetical protein
MLVVGIIALAVIAVMGMVYSLREGGMYDEAVGPVIGGEPPDWKPHEGEPWQERREPHGETDRETQ